MMGKMVKLQYFSGSQIQKLMESPDGISVTERQD
jgi:hypothetical protein